MPHLKPDDLVLLAFGEPHDGPDQSGHLRQCEACRAELAALTEVVAIAKAAPAQSLPQPPAHVWEGIAAQTTPAPAPEPSPAPAPVRRRPRGLRLALASALAAVVVLAGSWFLLRPADPQVVSAARLTAFGATPAQARGLAEVRADGTLSVGVDDLPSAGDGYYEVWLIDPTTLQMFSVGVLGIGQTATFPLPPTADLGRYNLVDVSVERYDNQPAHSGNSLLRGTLGAEPGRLGRGSH